VGTGESGRVSSEFGVGWRVRRGPIISGTAQGLWGSPMREISPVIAREFKRGRFFLPVMTASCAVLLPLLLMMVTVLRHPEHNLSAIVGVARLSALLLARAGWVLVSFSAWVLGSGSVQNDMGSGLILDIYLTGLFPSRIVHAKLLAAWSKAFLCGLLTLPPLVLCVCLGAMPASLVFIYLAFTAVGAGFYASSGVLWAVHEPKQWVVSLSPRGLLSFAVVVVLLLSTVTCLFPLPLMAVWVDARSMIFEHPPLLSYIPSPLIAAIPPLTPAFLWPLEGPLLCPRTLFMALAIVLQSLLSALMVLAAPRVLDRSLRRALGWMAEAEAEWSFPREVDGSFLRVRPSLGPEENPFRWVERGWPTRMLQRTTLPVLLVSAALVVIALLEMPARYVFTPEFCPLVSLVAIAILSLRSLSYGAGVFAREKVRGREGALILTGNNPWRVYRAKICAMLWGLRYPCLVVAAPTLVYALFASEASPALVAALLLATLVMPCVLGILGLAFGAAAPRHENGSGTALCALVVAAAAGVAASYPDLLPEGHRFGIIAALIAACGSVSLLLRKRRWSVPRLGMFLCFISSIAALAHALLVRVFTYVPDLPPDLPEQFTIIWITLGAVVAVCVTMLVLALRIFDSCMLSEIK